MAVTAAIIGSVAAVGSTAYGAISANQRSQDAKGQAAKALASAPNAVSDAAKAAQEAAAAADKQRKKTLAAKGYADTILTSPKGLPTAPSTGKGHATLLGL